VAFLDFGTASHRDHKQKTDFRMPSFKLSMRPTAAALDWATPALEIRGTTLRQRGAPVAQSRNSLQQKLFQPQPLEAIFRATSRAGRLRSLRGQSCQTRWTLLRQHFGVPRGAFNQHPNAKSDGLLIFNPTRPRREAWQSCQDGSGYEFRR